VRAPLGIVAALFGLVGAGLHALNAADGRVIEPSVWLLSTLGAVAFGVTGGLLTPRRVAPLSAVMVGIGLGQGLSMLAREYALLGEVPLDGVALWVGSWLWAPALLAIGVLLPLLLPEGSLPSPRWRPALVLSGVALGGQSVMWALTPYDRQDVPFDVRGLENPVGVSAAAEPAIIGVAAAVTALAMVIALASLAVRWRHADDQPRQQLKWLGLGGVTSVLLFVAGLMVAEPLSEIVAASAVLPLPVAATVAALRHRLWDVDLVVAAGLRYAVLSAIVVAVYATVVSLLGARSGAPVAATAVVAVVLLPLHGRVQRWVNEWVYGEPDDPGTALARLGDRL
jgi:two-component system NarL family sensor kinase